MYLPSELTMNRNPDDFIFLPDDPEERRKCLYGIVMICDDGEEWYDYDDERTSPPTPSTAPPDPRDAPKSPPSRP